MSQNDYVSVENVADFDAFVADLRVAFAPTKDEYNPERDAHFFARGEDMSVLFSAIGTRVSCSTQPGRGRQLFDLIAAMSPAYDVVLFGPEGEDIAERPAAGVR